METQSNKGTQMFHTATWLRIQISGHSRMLGDLIQVYVSWVISNASKHNMWYPKEEKPQLKDRNWTNR